MGVGRQALRMASELECSGVYLGSCRMGCMLKGCLLFIDIMMAEVREARCPSSSIGSVLVDFLKGGGNKNTSERKEGASHSERGGLKKKTWSWKSGTPAGPPASSWPPSDSYNRDARCLRRIYRTRPQTRLLIGRSGPPPAGRLDQSRGGDPTVATPSRGSPERRKDASKILSLETFEDQYVCPHKNSS